MATIDNVPSIAALTAVAAHLVGNSANATAPHLPFYPQNLLPANWYLNLPNFTERMEVEKSGEQPLDLSSKSSGNNNNNGTALGDKLPSALRLPTLDSKHIFK